MTPRKNVSLLSKVFLLFAVSIFALARISTATAQSPKPRRYIDIQIPKNVPLEVKLKKDKEKEFQDLYNERWIRAFELEVKNTGDRPIYALSLVWVMLEVKMPDGNPYGGTLLYGRSQFRTEPDEVPKPEDDPIEPSEIHVFKLNEPTVGGWESWAKENDLHPKDLLVFFNFLCFGDGTGLEGPNGQPFNLKVRNENQQAQKRF